MDGHLLSQVSLGDSGSALAEAPFPNAADGKWHRVSVVQQNEALRLSWDGSDGLAASGNNHKHLAFVPNSHIDFGKLKLKLICVAVSSGSVYETGK